MALLKPLSVLLATLGSSFGFLLQQWTQRNVTQVLTVSTYTKMKIDVLALTLRITFKNTAFFKLFKTLIQIKL